MALAQLFPGRDLSGMDEALRRRAQEFGLPYRRSDRLSNSRLAIEAAEFARDAGRFDAFSRAVFRAYFGEGRDIGDAGVLRELAADVTLDPDALQEALTEGRYAGRREAAAAEARRLGFSGVPTFVFPQGQVVVGAQPLAVFERVLRGLAAGDSA